MTTLVRQSAPLFTAPAVNPQGEIVEEFDIADLRGRYVALFFYPLDFTFVCPTEILSFDKKVEDLRAKDCEIIGVSVDSQYAHRAWREMPIQQGGIGPIRFPLIADITKSIARDYGVLVDDAVALRATFLIDREGVVRHQIVNDLALGRQIDETVRVLDALRLTERTNQVCPADWEEGETAMTPTALGVRKYLSVFANETVSS